MPKLTEAYISSLKDVVSGKVTLDENGQFFANEPRLSLIMTGCQMDECGLLCVFIHFPKKRNGHFFSFDPPGPCLLPEWDMEPTKSSVSLMEQPEGYVLVYTHSLFLPVRYLLGGGITFRFEHLQDEIREHLAVIAENQSYTQEWYRYVRSKKSLN